MTAPPPPAPTLAEPLTSPFFVSRPTGAPQTSSDSSIETVASFASSSYSTSSSSFDSYPHKEKSPYSNLVIEDLTTAKAEGKGLQVWTGLDERGSKSAPGSRRGSHVEMTGPSFARTFTGTPESSPALSPGAPLGMTVSDPSPSTTSPPSAQPAYFRSLPPLNTSSPSTSSSALMARSLSNTSLTSPRSPFATTQSISRPGSAGTFSTSSSNRSSASVWSMKSESSLMTSGSESTGTGTETMKSGGTRWEKEGRLLVEDGQEGEGEVYRVASDGMEFLDPRPEPAGAKLSLNLSDPTHLILRITLPGFSLDNITVAMRRGHKVHIVADSYGENGGHFEKLVMLGTDVQSSAPRAEFNGTELRVYIKRRHSTPQALSRKNTGTGSGSGAVATRSTGPSLEERSAGKSLCGPEGAKAAAKKAKEEAASRAKEQAKALPKATRKLPFAGKKPVTAPAGEGREKEGTIGRATKLTLSVPELGPTTLVRKSSGSKKNAESAGSSEERTLPRSTSPASSSSSPSSPARPKFESHSTLRPSGATFAEAAMAAKEKEGEKDEESEGRSSSGGVTPKGEKKAFSFTPFGRTA